MRGKLNGILNFINNYFNFNYKVISTIRHIKTPSNKIRCFSTNILD